LPVSILCSVSVQTEFQDAGSLKKVAGERWVLNLFLSEHIYAERQKKETDWFCCFFLFFPLRISVRPLSGNDETGYLAQQEPSWHMKKIPCLQAGGI
jgi:hypothetical protein